MIFVNNYPDDKEAYRIRKEWMESEAAEKKRKEGSRDEMKKKLPPAAVLPGQLDIVTELEKLNRWPSDEGSNSENSQQLQFQQGDDDERKTDNSTEVTSI